MTYDRATTLELLERTLEVWREADDAGTVDFAMADLQLYFKQMEPIR
jgi:hypothetical protein